MTRSMAIPDRAGAASLIEELRESLSFDIRNTADRGDRQSLNAPVLFTRDPSKNKLLLTLSVRRDLDLGGRPFHFVVRGYPAFGLLHVVPASAPEGWTVCAHAVETGAEYQYDAPPDLDHLPAGTVFSFALEGSGAPPAVPLRAGMLHVLIRYGCGGQVLGARTQCLLTVPGPDPGKPVTFYRSAFDAGARRINDSWNVLQQGRALFVPERQKDELFANDLPMKIVSPLEAFVASRQPKAVDKSEASALYLGFSGLELGGLDEEAVHLRAPDTWTAEKRRNAFGIYWELRPKGGHFFAAEEWMALRFDDICLDSLTGPLSIVVGFDGLPDGGTGAQEIHLRRIRPQPVILAPGRGQSIQGWQDQQIACSWETFGGEVTLQTLGAASSVSTVDASFANFMIPMRESTLVTLRVADRSATFVERVLASFEDLRPLGFGRHMGALSKDLRSKAGGQLTQLILTNTEWVFRYRNGGHAGGKLITHSYTIEKASWKRLDDGRVECVLFVPPLRQKCFYLTWTPGMDAATLRPLSPEDHDWTMYPIYDWGLDIWLYNILMDAGDNAPVTEIEMKPIDSIPEI